MWRWTNQQILVFFGRAVWDLLKERIKSNKIPITENNNRSSGPGRHYSSRLARLHLFSACVVLSLNDRQAQSGFQTPVWQNPGALDSTDLNSSCEPVDIGRDPSFSFYFSPAAVLRVNFVHAALFHRLENERSTKQKHCEVMFCLHSVQQCVWEWACRKRLPYHKASMADVPRESGHGPFLRVHNGVLDDVRRAGHVLWKVALHPAGWSASFGQQTSGNEAVGWTDLPENDVLCQNMVAVARKEKWLLNKNRFWLFHIQIKHHPLFR